MASSEKRCHYAVLGLSMECTPEEIRSAYRKLALQRHPDKLVKSGALSEAEATAAFQELVSAYEVLSDPKERAWYDSHRSQILFSDPASTPNSNFPDLFSYFSNTVYSGYSDSGRGFYKVYADLFDRVYANEIGFAKRLGLGIGAVKEAPVMGNLESPYTQVTAFYNYWLGFCTVMDFCWVDQYDAMAGMNRKSRRVMEEENQKLRKKAKREYNDTVRRLADFVKKRDKRVIDMQVKKGQELERKREEERQRRMEEEKRKLEKMRAYEEPEWARVDEEEILEDEGDEEEEGGEGSETRELYCVLCRKKFKSDKQWKNHEQSKKHKDKVLELRNAYQGEEEDEDEVDVEKEDGGVEMDEKSSQNREEEDEAMGLEEQFQDCVEICQEGNLDEQSSLEEDVKEGNPDEEQSNVEVDGQEVMEGEDEESTVNSAGEERALLEAMLTGRRNRRKSDPLVSETQMNSDNQDSNLMEYNIRKSSRRNRNRKEKGSKTINGRTSADADKGCNIDESEKTSGENDQTGPSLQDALESETNGTYEQPPLKHKSATKKPADRKSTAKKDVQTVPKSSNPKGKKSKGAKASGNSCDTCGEEFDSKNKLHKHLGETGHASLKHK